MEQAQVLPLPSIVRLLGPDAGIGSFAGPFDLDEADRAIRDFGREIGPCTQFGQRLSACDTTLRCAFSPAARPGRLDRLTNF